MRDAYGRFVAGVSGNPGGRPRGAYALRQQVREMAPQLVKALFAIARDDTKPTGARVMATSLLLDRAYGRPGRAEPIRPAEDLQQLSDAELDELIAEEDEEEMMEAEAEEEAAKR